MANPITRLDKLIQRVGEITAGAPRVHAGVQFDNASGLGGIPDASNIDYRGFMAYMQPKRFLQVNPPRDLSTRPIDHILQALDDGQPIGTPVLYVDKSKDGNWQVRGHEGRGRMMALQQRAPDAYFPVAIHPLGETRARHLAPPDAFNWLRADEGGSLLARPAAAVLSGKPYVSPADAEFFGKHGRHPSLEELLQELGSQAR